MIERSQRFRSEHLATAQAGLTTHAVRGCLDLLDGAREWRLWHLMGSGEMRRRFARARLGQVWIMLSSAIMVSTIGAVWAFLWNQPARDMLPFIAVGMMTWQLISGILSDSTTALPANSHYFLNQYIPASTIIYSVVYRNTVTFLLNMMFPLALSFALGVPLTIYQASSVFGLVILIGSSLSSAYVIAILCARFRDVVQIVGTVLQVAFFVTPVLWKPEFLPDGARQFLTWNPLSVLIAVVRDPLLGRPVPWMIWFVGAGIMLISFIIALPFIGKFHRRLVYWL